MKFKGQYTFAYAENVPIKNLTQFIDPAWSPCGGECAHVAPAAIATASAAPGPSFLLMTLSNAPTAGLFLTFKMVSGKLLLAPGPPPFLPQPRYGR